MYYFYESRQRSAGCQVIPMNYRHKNIGHYYYYTINYN